MTFHQTPPLADQNVLLIYGETLNVSNGRVDSTSLFPGAMGRYLPGNESFWGSCAFHWPPVGRERQVSALPQT